MFFHVFFAFFVFLCFWGHLENSSFTCMGAQFWRTQSIIVRFFVFFGNVLKTGFRPPRFFTFFHHFGGLLGGLLGIFWRPLGILWEAFWNPFWLKIVISWTNLGAIFEKKRDFRKYTGALRQPGAFKVFFFDFWTSFFRFQFLDRFLMDLRRKRHPK